jgi:uncharacterized protein with GYD domain
MVGLSAISEARGGIESREVHEILRNSRRQLVIEHLNQRMEPISLRVLAEDIAAIETGKSPPPRKARDSVYNSLHQTHLPKLDDMGVVEYDKDRKIIRHRRRAKQVSRYMRLVTDSGISWAELYRTVGVIALVAIVGAEADAPLIGGVSVLLLATVCLAIFAVTTAYQMWTLRWFYMRTVLGSDSTPPARGD